MSMVKVIINRLLEIESRSSQTRELIYADICDGTTPLPDGFTNLLGNERNASCQKIGLLVGYAMAIGMESDILTRVQANFAGRQFYTSNANGTVGTTDRNSEANNGGEVSEASEIEANGPGETNGTDQANGNDEVDRNSEKSDESHP